MNEGFPFSRETIQGGHYNFCFFYHVTNSFQLLLDLGYSCKCDCMVSDFWTFTLLSWFLKAIFLLNVLPLNRLDRASNISFGVLLKDTWGIKWYLMELAIILLALIISFLCLAFASSPFGSTTSSFMKHSRSFSSRMNMIPYFHALKFSIPSRFSSAWYFFSY